MSSQDADDSPKDNADRVAAFRRPGAATGAGDEESGTVSRAMDGAERARALRALQVMRDRGLIPAEEFDRRRAMLAGKDAP